MLFTRIGSALALALGSVGLMALGPVTTQDGDLCPPCISGAVPASLHFPALPPSTCGVLFNIYSNDGKCSPNPEPPYPCEEDYGCFFWYQVLCQGDCSNVVPMLFSLGGTALPLYTPCGTNQDLGFLPCGQNIEVMFLVWDVNTGATAVKGSMLSCSRCDGSDG